MDINTRVLKGMDFIQNHSEKILFSFFILFFGFLYRDYWINDPLLNRDDIRLILPFSYIHSIGDYFTAVSNNKILDVQPIRDLTLFLNLELLDLSGRAWFHVFNFVLFLIVVILFHRLLKLLGFEKKNIILTLLLFGMHPVMVSAVGWVSARKHTLALIFIMLSILSFLKDRRIKNSTVIWYLLSLLSHQIFALFPVWIFVYQRFFQSSVQIKRFLFLFFAGAIVIAAGTYKTFILGMGNTMSIDLPILDNISRCILSISRSISILLFPIKISAVYDQGNLLNFAGIPFLVVGSMILLKSKARDSWIWMLLAAIAFAPTLFTFTNDTYLYLPLICFLIAANYYFKQYPLRLPRAPRYALLIILILLLGSKTISASGMWKSNYHLWRYSFENEESPYTQILLGRSILPVNKEKGMELFLDGVRNFDLSTNENITIFFLQTIHSSSMDTQQKITLLKEKFYDWEPYHLYLGLTLAEGNEDQMWEGIGILKKHLKPEQTYQMDSEDKKIYTSLKNLCKNLPEKKVVCDELSINTF